MFERRAENARRRLTDLLVEVERLERFGRDDRG